MAYEYEHDVINELEQIEDEYKLSYKNEINEVREVYRKAKAFDEIEQSYWKSNTPENFAYEFVRIFENRFSIDKECADDGIWVWT